MDQINTEIAQAIHDRNNKKIQALIAKRTALVAQAQPGPAPPEAASAPSDRGHGGNADPAPAAPPAETMEHINAELSQAMREGDRKKIQTLMARRNALAAAAAV